MVRVRQIVEQGETRVTNGEREMGVRRGGKCSDGETSIRREK